MGLPITTSPDITLLNFTVLYDISGAAPTITLTNTSVGSDLAACTWWYTIYTPNQVPIHVGSETSPDVVDANWSTITVPDTWPLTMSPAPNGQIEFSCSVPYTTRLYVKDSDDNIYSFAIANTICRPNGNTQNTLGNFGAASITVQVQCEQANVYASDQTNYSYQQLLGNPQDQTWTLTYPMDANGNLPSPSVVENAAYVLFPVGYSGSGYNIYVNTFCTYDFSNGGSIKIQYKSQTNPYQPQSFAVWCNISLCNLITEIAKFRKLVSSRCNTAEYPELMRKLTLINSMQVEVMMAINQPLCGKDVPALIKEIELLGNFDCNCCGNAGVNFGNGTPLPAAGGCCPVYVDIVDYDTSDPIPNCATGTYFPRSVFAPNGTTYIGIAYNASDIVSLMNNNGAWQALGVAFNTGNCTVGFYKVNAGTTVPDVVTAPAVGTGYGSDPDARTCRSNTQHYIAALTDKCSSNLIFTFPTVASVNYGSTEYSLGTVDNIGELVTALGTQPNKPASISYSIAYLATGFGVLVTNSSCSVFSGAVNIFGNNSCNSTTVITVPVIDEDTDTAPALCPGSFFPATVREPDGVTNIGNANNATEMIALINGSTLWNAYGLAVFNGTNCSVDFTPAPGVSTIPDIKVVITSSCLNGGRHVNITVTDTCGSAVVLTAGDYPFEAFVNYDPTGSGVNISLGNVTSKANLLALLNAEASKPASVSYSNGANESDVIVNLSNCTVYNILPSIFGQLAADRYLLMGSNHSNLEGFSGGANGVYGVGLHGSVNIGRIPGADNTAIQWHTIKIGNYLISSESDTGKIYFYDVTNPLMPILVNTVQLTTLDADNFTGTVQCAMSPVTGLVDSFYGLYFPTAFYATMSIEEIYVVESNTGCIWKIGMTAGVIGGFQDTELLGKCPRVLTGGKLYFTQDGDLETYTASSTVTKGRIVVLDTSDFTSTGLSTVLVFLNETEYVWAADFDGIDTIYFVGQGNVAGGAASACSVATYSISGSSVTNRYLHIGPLGTLQYRGNACYFAGKLYVATTFKTASNTVFYFDVSTFGTTNTVIQFAPLFTASGIEVYYPYNVKPLGNCLLAVTYNVTTAGGATKWGGVKLYTLGGSAISAGYIAQPDSVDLYNVIPFPNIGVYTPTTLV